MKNYMYSNRIRRIFALCALVALACPVAIASESVKITDLAGRVSSPVEMIVEATLEDAATGIEIKAPMPAGMEYVEGSAVIAEGRADGHSISVGLKDGELRILIYSLLGKVLNGSDGELCRLQLKLGNEPGDFMSTPMVTAITAGLNRREVLADPFNITTTAPRIRVENTWLDFGRIPTLVEQTQSVQVYNTGNDVLHITGYESTNSDISVPCAEADIAPGESYYFDVVYKATTPGEKNDRLTFTSDAANSCPSVNIHSLPYLANEVYYTVEYDEANDDYVVTMNLTNQQEIVAIDTWFDLSYGSHLEYVEGSAKLSDRASDHKCVISTSEQAAHVIIYSMSSTPFSGQDGAVLTMRYKYRGSEFMYVILDSWGDKSILGTKDGVNVNTQDGQKSVGFWMLERPWSCEGSSASAYVTEDPIATIRIISYENTSLIIEQVRFDDPDFVCDEQMPVIFPSEWSEKELKVRYKGKEFGKHSTYATIVTNRGNLLCSVEFTLLDTKFDCRTSYAGDAFSSCVVDVDMKNVVDIAAIQMDIFLPEWRPDIQLNDAEVVFGDRMSAHSHVLNKVGERQYRLIVYSMSNQPISGDEGVVLSLPLFSSENMDLRGQQIELRNIVISDTRGKNHAAPDIYYQLAQLYRVAFIVDGKAVYSENLEYGSEIVAPEDPVKEGHTFVGWDHEVEATVPDYDVTYEALFTVNQYTLTYIVDGVTYRVQVLDYGTAIEPLDEPVKEDYTFSGWSEIPETMPAHDVEVTGTFTRNPVAGDVNWDYKVNITDAVDIVNDRLGYESANFDRSRSDVNQDSQFTIADATAVINIMYGDPVDAANPARSVGPDEEIIKFYQSEENVLSVAMNTHRNYSAFEFELDLPEGVSVDDISINEQRCNNFIVQFNELHPGLLKVVAFNFENEAFKAGDGNILKIFTTGSSITDKARLKNIHFSTDKAVDVAFGEVNLTSGVTGVGMISHDDSSNTPSYNLKGQRIKAPAHGIVIMHGKKVFIK